MNIKELHKKFLECGGAVTTDSRTVKGGELFFALKGENFDGNEYALTALDAGAKYAVVDKDSPALRFKAGSVEDARSRDDEGRSRLIPVEDTLATLQALARWHRSATFVDGKPLTVIALTGTNGKTTTKELIRAVLATKYVVTATQGNLNNNIGVPLTLLKINEKTQLAVVEMGASHPGDINELTAIALPNYGLITNVGKAHLLGFGSLEGVIKTKGELYDYLQRTADKVFLNTDNPRLYMMASERPDLETIKYGLRYDGAIVLPSSDKEPFLRISLAGGRVVKTNLIGTYNADNVMAALAVGRHFGVDDTEAVAAIEAYQPSNNRSQMVKTEANTLIVDAYNANPTSMEAALAAFDVARAEHKAALLGNMLELGEDSVTEHVKVVERLATIAGLDLAILVGEEFRKALEEMGAAADTSASTGTSTGAAAKKSSTAPLWFATSAEAADYLTTNPLRNHYILIKGSRGSKMETTIPVL